MATTNFWGGASGAAKNIANSAIKAGQSVVTSAQRKKKKDTLSPIVDKIGNTLSGMKSFEQVNPFSSTQKIYDTLAAQTKANIYDPQYKQFQYNPFQRNWANTMAGNTGNAVMGNRNRVYTDTFRKDVEMPYQAEVDAMETAYRGMAQNKWNQDAIDYYNDPTAFTNYSAFKN